MFRKEGALFELIEFAYHCRINSSIVSDIAIRPPSSLEIAAEAIVSRHVE